MTSYVQWCQTNSLFAPSYGINPFNIFIILLKFLIASIDTNKVFSSTTCNVCGSGIFKFLASQITGKLTWCCQNIILWKHFIVVYWSLLILHLNGFSFFSTRECHGHKLCKQFETSVLASNLKTCIDLFVMLILFISWISGYDARDYISHPHNDSVLKFYMRPYSQSVLWDQIFYEIP